MTSDEESVWITFNGEIYNFLEIRDDLLARGHKFRSNTDTEVLLRLYLEFGTDCLHYLRGMFAFGIWDARIKSLFLARDRIGKKPLFYYFNGQMLAFSSEIKSLFAIPEISRDINLEALYDYFKFLYVPDPKTIYKNIYKLPPAHYLLCTSEGVEKKEYWDIRPNQTTSKKEEDVAGELLALFEESVRLRMISDVPLGAFLSGGIDSSAVVALMSRQQNDPVTTCTIGFEDKNYDETSFAHVISKEYRTDHHEYIVRQDVEHLLPTLAYHFDEPFADASAVPTYYVCQLTRKMVTVALSGDGGDECFAGYEKYHVDAIENRLRRFVPDCVRHTLFPFLARYLRLRNEPSLRKATTLLNALSRDSAQGFYMTNSEMSDYLWNVLARDFVRKELKLYDPSQLVRYYYDRADTGDHLAKIMYVDMKTYLPGDILVKVDRTSMAHSLEVRAPMLDHKFLEYVSGIPSRLKYSNGAKKIVLKKALRSILPREIMSRKKMGFSAPVDSWFREDLRQSAEGLLLSPRSGIGEFMDTNVIRDIWGVHLSGRRNYGAVLWSLLMFEHWYRCYMT